MLMTTGAYSADTAAPDTLATTERVGEPNENARRRMLPAVTAEAIFR